MTSGLPTNAPATYDKRDGHPVAFQLGASITFVGTSTAATAYASSYARIPFNCKLVGMTVAEETGATAAGPAITLNRSVGGTGSYAALATHTFATTASTAGSDTTVTAVDIGAGDIVTLNQVIGTTATSARLGRVMLELLTQPN